MNKTSVGHASWAWGERRPEGHRIRLDVLLSAVQKGVRRCDPTVSLWAVALLCRAGYWMLALHAVTQCGLEETNAWAEPVWRDTWWKQVKRLRTQLARKGVSVDTELARRLMCELTLDVTLASKSRLAVHAMEAAYGTLADEAKALRAQLPQDPDARLVHVFTQFKRHWEDKRDGDTFLWLTLLDLLGDTNTVYGSERVWRLVQHPEAPQAERCAALCQLLDAKFVPDPYTRRVMLYEAVAYRLYPWRAVPPELKAAPSARLDPAARQGYLRHWKATWDETLEPASRRSIDWDVWHPCIMDLTTAVGRNHDTVAELQRKHPDFPADEYTAPDYAGVAFPSCVIHDFTVCQQLTLRAVADPYENKARQFLASIERGQCAPALGKGWASAELESIRAALRRMLVPPDAPVPANLASGPRTTLTERRGKRKLSMPLSVASDLSSAPVSEANSAATSAAASPLPSAAAAPGRTARANSADPLRSHTVNKAPCLLPGFTVQHQDTVSGPSELDGWPVTYCHLAELPVPGRAPRWFVGLNDRSAWVVQRTSEMLTTVPMFLDRIKGRFGLPALGLRFLEQVWLVMRDPGQGGPYATQPVGPRRYDVVKWGLAGLHSLDAADWVWTEPALEQATKHLVFRALFRVTDTPLATLVWSDRERKVLSWGEWGTSLEPLPTPEACPVLSNLLLCKTKQYLPVYHARDPALESLTAYWALPTTRARVRHWLDQWEPILYEIPHPPRPVHDLPTANVVLQNLAAMRAHWVDAAAVTPSTPPAP